MCVCVCVCVCVICAPAGCSGSRLNVEFLYWSTSVQPGSFGHDSQDKHREKEEKSVQAGLNPVGGIWRPKEAGRTNGKKRQHVTWLLKEGSGKWAKKRMSFCLMF